MPQPKATPAQRLNPPAGYKLCVRCGARLAPLPLACCRDCYIEVQSGRIADAWDHANERQMGLEARLRRAAERLPRL